MWCLASIFPDKARKGARKCSYPARSQACAKKLSVSDEQILVVAQKPAIHEKKHRFSLRECVKYVK